MVRPLRLEYANALYHVTARGDRRENIYRDDNDREFWLEVLTRVCHRFNWVLHAYCQMHNHYHLVVETVEGHLSRGMQQLNGHYTQRFNRRHGLVGHLYQGRYKAILVQRESYLLELSRYVVLNPVRARLIHQPEDWPWSSYRALVGIVGAPPWLDTDGLLGQFGPQQNKAIRAYRDFVMAGNGAPSPLEQTRHQVLLGDDAFVERWQQNTAPNELREVSKVQRRAVALALVDYQQRFPKRDEAMARAYLSGAYTMAEIGRHFGVHYMTVSRALRKFERK
jgi:putative transposase